MCSAELYIPTCMIESSQESCWLGLSMLCKRLAAQLEEFQSDVPSLLSDVGFSINGARGENFPGGIRPAVVLVCAQGVEVVADLDVLGQGAQLVINPLDWRCLTGSHCPRSDLTFLIDGVNASFTVSPETSMLAHGKR